MFGRGREFIIFGLVFYVRLMVFIFGGMMGIFFFMLGLSRYGVIDLLLIMNIFNGYFENISKKSKYKYCYVF